MVKIIAFLSVFLLMHYSSLAQPTATDNKKMVEEANKRAAQIMNDPKVKAMMEQVKAMGKQTGMPNIDSMIKAGSKGAQAGIIKTKKNDSTAFSVPVKNDKYLGALPVRVFNKAELVSYLHNLDTKLTGILQSSFGTDIKNIPENNISSTATSIVFWVKGHPNESVLTALKAALQNPGNATLLNNIGGVLTSSGLPVNAIPILQYANQQEPDNNVILNNLGQAYFALGDLDKAKQYLLQSVSTAEYYPDANLTLGYIYKKKGDKSSAIRYAENSLRGAYSADAYSLLHNLNPDAKLMDYVRHRYKQPSFFNYHKYPLLPQCLTVDDAPVLKPKYDAYLQALLEMENNYSRISRDENEAAKTASRDIIANALKTHRSPYRPFAYFAIAVLADLDRDYTDKFLRYEQHKKDYLAQLKELDIKYEAEIKVITDRWTPILNDLEAGSQADEDAAEKFCKEKNDVGNIYLPQYATLTESFQMETIILYRNYLNDWSYWSYIASFDDHAFKAVFNSLAATMVRTLRDINRTKFIDPCIIPEKPMKKKTNINGIEEPDCFFKPKIVLPLGGVNFEISCEGYKLEAGEGLIGKIEYSRESGDVTIAFGVGAKAPKLFFDKGGVEGGVEAEVKSQFFVTFNKGDAIDCGVLWETEIKAKLGVGGSKSGGIDPVEATIGIEEGLTAGFGSGVQMKEGGPLKALIDRTYQVQPDDKQINKNVPLYKK